MRKLRFQTSLSLLTISLGVSACTAGSIGDRFIPVEERSAVVTSWLLVSRADQALTDPAVPHSGYPNAGEFDEVIISLHTDALLCGEFRRGGRTTLDACGGPAEGLPYFVVPTVIDAELHLRVMDIFGNAVRTAGPVQNACIFADSQCNLCSGELGTIETDPCGLADGTASSTMTPGNLEGNVSETCFTQGAQAFIDFANQALADIDMPQWPVRADELAEPVDGLEAEAEGERVVVVTAGVPRSMQPVDNICEQYGAGSLKIDGSTPLRDDYRWEGNTVRCGFLANDALVSGCAQATPSCTGPERYDFELGVLAAHNAWVGDGRNWDYAQRADANECGFENPDCTPSPGPECVGSPLVMSVDTEPVALTSQSDGVEFDIMGTGHRVRTGWVQHGALLALDRNFNGRIDSGRELFGEATRLTTGHFAANGFEALAQYDDPHLGGNGDGRITAADAIFTTLRLWSDANVNGESEPDELTRLEAHGVESIGLTARPIRPSSVDAAGNLVPLRSDATRADGTSTPVFDVWFRYGTAPLAQHGK